MKCIVYIFITSLFFINILYGQERKGLSVLEFRVEGTAPESSGKVIADLITNRIKLDQYFIVERTRLSDILKERLISLGDTLSQEDIKNLQHLGVSFVMIGQIANIENKYYGGYRIVDVMNARIGESDSIVGAKDFSDFIEKTYHSLILKKFIQDEVFMIVKKDWIEQKLQNLEQRLVQQEKITAQIQNKIFKSFIGWVPTSWGKYNSDLKLLQPLMFFHEKVSLERFPHFVALVFVSDGFGSTGIYYIRTYDGRIHYLPINGNTYVKLVWDNQIFKWKLDRNIYEPAVQNDPGGLFYTIIPFSD